MNHIRQTESQRRSNQNLGQTLAQTYFQLAVVCLLSRRDTGSSPSHGGRRRVIGAQTAQKLMRDSGWRRN